MSSLSKRKNINYGRMGRGERILEFLGGFRILDCGFSFVGKISASIGGPVEEGTPALVAMASRSDPRPRMLATEVYIGYILSSAHFHLRSTMSKDIEAKLLRPLVRTITDAVAVLSCHPVIHTFKLEDKIQKWGLYKLQSNLDISDDYISLCIYIYILT